MSDFDAIVVPGGGVTPDGELLPWVRDRFDHVIERYAGELIITLSQGTVHKPPVLDERGFPVTEAHAGARYLRERGIAPERLRIEACSYDTIGNAWFCRLLHVDPLGLRRLLVVTSDFHLDRVEACFRWVFGLAPASVELTFEGVALQPGHLPASALAARVEKERAAVRTVEALAARIATVPEMHRWINTEHAAYAVDLPATDIGPAVDTY